MNILNGVSPVQISTNSFVTVTGSTLDASRALTISFTITNTGDNSITWQPIGGNVSDLSDGVVVQDAAALAKDAVSSYSVYPAPFKYYGVQIKATAGGSQGEATIYGVAKG